MAVVGFSEKSSTMKIQRVGSPKERYISVKLHGVTCLHTQRHEHLICDVEKWLKSLNVTFDEKKKQSDMLMHLSQCFIVPLSANYCAWPGYFFYRFNKESFMKHLSNFDQLFIVLLLP
jgi:hypothetical protein